MLIYLLVFYGLLLLLFVLFDLIIYLFYLFYFPSLSTCILTVSSNTLKYILI